MRVFGNTSFSLLTNFTSASVDAIIAGGMVVVLFGSLLISSLLVLFGRLKLMSRINDGSTKKGIACVLNMIVKI